MGNLCTKMLLNLIERANFIKPPYSKCAEKFAITESSIAFFFKHRYKLIKTEWKFKFHFPPQELSS